VVTKKYALYVEGGERKALRIEAQKAFKTFLCKIDPSLGQSLQVVACGSGSQAGRKFTENLARPVEGQKMLLLVDSEGAVARDASSWDKRHKERIPKPHGVKDDQCHLMVEFMENWFFAEKSVIKHSLPNFREASAPGHSDIECIAMKDAKMSLEKAGYEKGEHSFKILAKLDPHKVRKASLRADLFLRSFENTGNNV
jgi:hypothetical protein